VLDVLPIALQVALLEPRFIPPLRQNINTIIKTFENLQKKKKISLVLFNLILLTAAHLVSSCKEIWTYRLDLLFRVLALITEQTDLHSQDFLAASRSHERS
jgi:hypothetical protein